MAPALREIHVATFDTRLKMKFVTLFGFSAEKMAAQFKDKGNRVDAKPEGFIVTGRSGPLAEGELERAASWGRDLARRYSGA